MRLTFECLLGADAAEAALQRVAKALARVFRKRRRLGIAEDLNRLLGGVDDDAAILAVFEMLFDGGPQRGIQRFVEVI